MNHDDDRVIVTRETHTQTESGLGGFITLAVMFAAAALVAVIYFVSRDEPTTFPVPNSTVIMPIESQPAPAPVVVQPAPPVVVTPTPEPVKPEVVPETPTEEVPTTTKE